MRQFVFTVRKQLRWCAFTRSSGACGFGSDNYLPVSIMSSQALRTTSRGSHSIRPFFVEMESNISLQNIALDVFWLKLGKGQPWPTSISKVLLLLQTVSVTTEIQIGHLIQSQNRVFFLVSSNKEVTRSIQAADVVEEIFMRCLVGSLQKQFQRWR